MFPINNTAYNRLFIAINLENQQDLMQLLQNFRSSLKSENIHWVKDQNLHLTLKFIGKIQENELNSVQTILENTCNNFGKINLQYEKIGLFGSSHSPKVIWLGITSNEDLIKLNTLLSKELRSVGIKADVQNFVPHITLARIHQKIKSIAFFQKVMDAYKNPNITPTTINTIYLLNSEIKKDGPSYQIVSTYPLNQ